MNDSSQRPESRAPILYLTFDDGPLEPFTSRILDVLKKFRAHATFFVCGLAVQRHPNLVKRMVQEGHGVGNHTYSHSFKKTVFGCLINEMRVTDDLITINTGRRPFWFRPPWGILMPHARVTAKSFGYRIALWNVMGFDWQSPPASSITERISKKARPDSIILLHDGNEGKPDGNREQTVEAVRLLLEKYSSKGYRFAALPEDADYLNRSIVYRDIPLLLGY